MNKQKCIMGLMVCMACLAPFISWSQSQSAWLTSEARAANFPADSYIWGFVPGNLGNGETESALLTRLKTDAKQEAAGKIRTTVESKTILRSGQTSDGVNFALYSAYQNYTEQTSDAEIAGFKLETYYDSYQKIGYAFAYVKKSELASYYQSQINKQLQQVRNTLTTVSTAVNTGQKIRARKSCEEALQLMAKTAYMQDLLSAIGYADDKVMQLDEYSQIKNSLADALDILEQSIYIYMKCDETNLKTPVKILGPELRRILSNNHCSFTEDPEQADYKITITASTRQHDGNVAFGDGTLKFSLADVDVELYSNYKKMEVYNGKITQKNNKDGATYESAGINALKLAASKVWDEIKPWILGK